MAASIQGTGFGCCLIVLGIILLHLTTPGEGQVYHYSKRLYKDTIYHFNYSSKVRPVPNTAAIVEVHMMLKLWQLIDVDEPNTYMTTGAGLFMEWNDPDLHWDPADYYGVNLIYVPAEDIWHPDIVLLNNADGGYEMTKGTKAILTSDGTVKWRPPATFKSSCTIDVLYFPFDEQTCEMQFGSWTYNNDEIKLIHSFQLRDEYLTYEEFDELEYGVDLSEFDKSVEWDIMKVPAKKDYFKYAGSAKNHTMWSFKITMQRKFLFYTVNLIIPLVSHTFMTVLVFYLPAASQEKISLAITILLSLTVYFLMLAEIIPSTSLVVPLLSQYLLFTMALVTISVIITGITINIHFRESHTHNMGDWTRKIFLRILPKMLFMKRPKIENSHDLELKHIKLTLCDCCGLEEETGGKLRGNGDLRYQFGSKRTRTQADLITLAQELDDDDNVVFKRDSPYSREVQKAIQGAIYIANHLKADDEASRIKEDWKYVALVVDRICLLFFAVGSIVGTGVIIFAAPVLFDDSVPLMAIGIDFINPLSTQHPIFTPAPVHTMLASMLSTANMTI